MTSPFLSGSGQAAEDPAEHLDAALVEDTVFLDDLQPFWNAELAEPSRRDAGA